MKCVILLSVFLVLEISGQGFPIAKCPAGEHSVLYCPQKAEPSCDNPTVHSLPKNSPRPCDVPQCFCNAPKVRNTKTKKCVHISEC
ncbi:unnamed protein product [Leptidea sinapis]|uniref:TIL domain-containing protein n=1 Tax=Leptidea sinapis TaxID=189913 RepID=A0A5E4QHI3_9NEOP|nr:unnamed protein product [Leptidea sinapis]